MEEPKKKPLWRRPLIIASGCLLLLVILFAGAEVWLGIKIRRTIEKEAASLSGGAYRVKVGHARFNIFNRSVRLREITVRSDSAVLAAKGSPLTAFRLDAAELFVKGIRFKNDNGNRTLSLSVLTLQSPQVMLVRDSTRRQNENKPDSTNHPPKKSLQEQMAGLLQKISIGRLGILDGTIDLCEYRNGKRLCHSVEGISIHTDNLCLDATADSANGTFFSGDIRTSVGGLSYTFNEGAVKLEVDTLSIDTKAGLLSVSGIRLLPQYPKSSFASLTRNHADWTQVIAGTVVCSGIDFPALIGSKMLKVDSVGIRRVELASFKNRQIAQPQRIKPLFYETLQKMALDVDIRRINFDSINVTYQELSPDGTQPGTITFNKLGGDMYGMTNIASTEQPYFKIDAHGLLMDRGAVQATFSLPVDSTNNHFEVTGTLGTLNMMSLNQITEPLVNLQVHTGKINGMDFHITGGAEHSSVKMLLRYDNLNVRLVKERNGQIRERRFLSAVIDDLLIKDSNPDGRGTRTGTGTAERDPYRSQFNYLWKSLLPGVKSTLIGRNRSNRLSDKSSR